jgi:hypothetical protein
MILALGLSMPHVVRAAESYDNCTGYITSAPASITSQGTWCLKNDITASFISGEAIFVAANNVTVDCNGFKIVANPGFENFSSGDGVYADNRLNVTVRHCDIRGFKNGVLFTGASGGGHVVEDNRFDGNNTTGIYVVGDGSVIRRNWVFNTGGSPVNPYFTGIQANYSVDIIDNTISIVSATSGNNGSSYGIISMANAGGSIKDNRIRGVKGDGTGIATGIFSDDQVSLRNNEVTGDSSADSVGIGCTSANGRTKGNVIIGFATAIYICSNDGNIASP